MSKSTIYLFMPVLLIFAVSLPAQEITLSEKEGKSGMHAEPWAFGKSPDRQDLIWQKGVDGDEIEKQKLKKRLQKKRVQENAEAQKPALKPSLGLRWKDESASWKVTPAQKDVRPDEKRVRENSHVLGAYADLEAGDAFNISIGPELRIRDDSKGDESANPNQPDSELGMGMKFKFDF